MVRCGPGCKRLWGQAVEARMGPLGVVVVPPALDDLPGLAVAAEEMFVQACISQAPVEGCNKAVLHRRTGGDGVPGDSPILLPCEQRMRGQLRAGVADHQARQAARFRDAVELPGNTGARGRVVHHRRQTRPAEVVDDAQNAEAPTVDQGSGDEVQRPALVRSLRTPQGRPRAQRPRAAAAVAHRKTFFPVQPVQLLRIPLTALASQ